MAVSKTSDYIQIMIKMPNPCQEPSASSKAPNQDLLELDGLCTFRINLWSKILNMSVSKTSDYIQIKIKIPNPKKETRASSKAPNQVFKDMVVLCIFKIEVESQNLEQGNIKDHDYL